MPAKMFTTDRFNRTFSARRFRTGAALIYATAIMVVMLACASLAVDVGRAQFAKTELRAAADAAARYGAMGFANSTITSNAIAVAAQNKVDGTALALQNSDIDQGVWRNGAFHSNGSGTSAVRVTARRTNARGTAIPLLFTSMLGVKTLDLTVQSIATYVPGSTVTITAQSRGNPWLAGMPSGTTANDYDTAGADSPTLVSGMSIIPGGKLNFGFAGGASYLPNTSANGPDGDTSFILYNHIYTGFNGGREHGKSNLTAPITSVVGVFLDANQPDTQGAPPADLDFTSAASRDFASLSPELRQPFFIGDGLRADGVTAQDFMVPTGATRLYIGIMDGQQWSDNTGSFNTNITIPPTITVVK